MRAVFAWIRSSTSNPALRFVVFFLLFLSLQALAYPHLKQRFQVIPKTVILGTAQVEYLLLRIFTAEVSLSERLVVLDGFPVKIIEECTGFYEAIIFLAAVLAFPTSWRKKGIGVLLGLPLIYLFNLLRIMMLIVVGRYYRQAFDFMHLYFWQATMIIMITSVWLLWLIKVVRDEKEALPSHS